MFLNQKTLPLRKIRKMQKIIVEGTEITISKKQNQEYISITDIAKRYGEPRILIQNWIRTASTLDFLALWENLNNPNFNRIEFDAIRKQAGGNAFTMSPSRWVESTNAIGMETKAGRYNSGTFAQKDIAMEFCSWVEPAFRLFIIREFDRLKTVEATKLGQEWDLRRIISKTNYKIHTESVREFLIPQRLQRDKAAGLYYASEADLLNLALFGVTAKQWKVQNPNLKGNLRDHASIEQLLVLSNLESLNSELIKMGLSHDERLERLNDAAIYQMRIIVQSSTIGQLGAGENTLVIE